MPLANGFSGSVHKDITHDALHGFLKSEIYDDIVDEHIWVDTRFQFQSEYHYDNCAFQESTENIKNLYARAADSLDSNDLDIEDTPDAFGQILHVVQDFYAHTNWVELGKQNLVDDDLGEWGPLDPFSIVDENVVVVQGEDEDVGKAGYTAYSNKQNNKVIDMIKDDSPPLLGLISGSAYLADDCPDKINVGHWDSGGSFTSCMDTELSGYIQKLPKAWGMGSAVALCATLSAQNFDGSWPPYVSGAPKTDSGLNKDDSGADEKPEHKEAYDLAVAQTKHEWCRLVSLVENKYGTEGRNILFKNWVEDENAANLACGISQDISDTESNIISYIDLSPIPDKKGITDYDTVSEHEKFFVFWKEENSIGHDVAFFRSSLDAGKTFSTPKLIGEKNVAFPRLAFSDNILHVIWVDNYSGNKGKGKLMYMQSTDFGYSFSKPIELSSLESGSTYPSIVAEGKNVYITWEANYQNSIMFAKSNDQGETFDKKLDFIEMFEKNALLRQNPDLDPDALKDSYHRDESRSFRPQIYQLENHVYVVWKDGRGFCAGGGLGDVVVTASGNQGNTFGKPFKIVENDSMSYANADINANSLFLSFTGTATYDGTEYPGKIYHVKVSSSGSTALKDLSYKPTFGVGTPKIKVHENNVYVSWIEEIDDVQHVLFRKSADGGKTFGNFQIISAGGEPESLKLHVDQNNVYVLWKQNYLENDPAFVDKDWRKDILLSISHNFGETFDDKINISKSPGDSFNPLIQTHDKKPLITWVNHVGSRTWSLFFATYSTSEASMPEWVKNNAAWWSKGTIDDQTFVIGIQYLIKENMIQVSQTNEITQSDSSIPPWIKNNAKWWSEGTIDDQTFIGGIQYLVDMGIITVN